MRSVLIALMLVLGAMPVGADQTPSANESQDWPALISQLRDRVDRVAGDAQTRQQLAIAYNNYAVSLAEKGRSEDAIDQLEEGLRIDPTNAQLRRNLVMICLKAAQEAYQVHRIAEAKRLVNQAITASPADAEPYVLLGEIEYNAQRLKEAKAAWEKALAIQPNLPEVRTKLDQLNHELPVESNFEKLSQAYFDLRYTSALERGSGFDLQDMLLTARREVGSDFAFWPTRKIVVLIYSAEEFRKLRQQAPEWVAGQYDGKIRLPLPGQGVDQATVRRILYHEYTHALVYELTKGRLPLWFNEGLAEYEAWKHDTPAWILLRQALAAKQVLPWAALSDQFAAGKPASTVGLAYEQAHSIVRYLIERYSFWRIKRILKAVGSGETSFDEAFQAHYRLKPARLEEQWWEWLLETLSTSTIP